jgi:hypothetical protein
MITVAEERFFIVVEAVDQRPDLADIPPGILRDDREGASSLTLGSSTANGFAGFVSRSSASSSSMCCWARERKACTTPSRRRGVTTLASTWVW